MCDLVVMNPVVINKKTKKRHFYRILSQFEKHTEKKNKNAVKNKQVVAQPPKNCQKIHHGCSSFDNRSRRAAKKQRDFLSTNLRTSSFHEFQHGGETHTANIFQTFLGGSLKNLMKCLVKHRMNSIISDINQPNMFFFCSD